jgi:hypothetical protein
MTDYLPLQIASGILIAGTILLIPRFASWLWREGDRGAAVFVGGAFFLFAGALIAAGLGLVPW